MTDKILVIETEENLRQRYQNELQEEGYEVVTVADGREAFKKIMSEAVDLVILELEYDGSGLEYLQRFMKARRNLKVVIHTDYPNYKGNFHSWAADAFLVKSADLCELKKTIDTLLHAKRN
ncbi:MAG: response regulator [bacterium]